MFNKRELILACAGVSATVGIALALFIWPNHRAASEIDRQIAQLQGKVGNLQQQRERTQALDEKLSEARRRVDEELKLIPDSADVAGLIRKLSLAVDHITVMDQTFTAGSPADAIVGRAAGASRATAAEDAARRTASAAEMRPQAMPLSIEMESDFSSLFALLRNVESLDRLVRIASVRISSKRDNRASTTVTGGGAGGVGGVPVLKASIGLEAIFEPPVNEGNRQQAAGLGDASPALRAGSAGGPALRAGSIRAAVSHSRSVDAICQLPTDSSGEVIK